MLLVGALLGAGVPAAPSGSGFAPIPEASVTALGSSRGKPIRSGTVFVSGHYLKPPYTVKRQGTGIFIRDGSGRDWQVTGQVRRWTAFLATQGGLGADDEESVDDFFEEDDKTEKKSDAAPVTEEAKKSEAEPAAETAKSDDEPAATEKKPETEAKTEEKKPETEAKTEEKNPESDAKPAEKKDEPPRPFVHNARSKALLRAVDEMRRKIDKALRLDSMLVFSPGRRYLQLDARTAISAMSIIATGMKKDGDAREMAQRMRANGLSLFESDSCADFLRHRPDYPAIEERVRKMRSEAETRRMLDGVNLPR